MPNSATSRHPFLDLFAAAMAPWMPHGSDHSKDPPPLPDDVAPGLTSPELKSLVELFVAADHDMREDRYSAAVHNLDLAETRIRLAMSHAAGDGRPLQGYERALGDIAVAREAAARRDSAHGCGAVGDAVRALLPKPGR
jgi:hypothetical protein